MIDRRVAIGLLLAAFAWLAVSPTRAQDVQKLLPLLVDLRGWTGEDAQGVVFGSSTIGALRTYKRGDAMVEANFLRIAGEMPPSNPPGMNYADDWRHFVSSTVNGFDTWREFYPKNKQGQIFVKLRGNAFFALKFEGLAEDEAFSLARRFDWNAIAAALPK
jgi:hypothetical protein